MGDHEPEKVSTQRRITKGTDQSTRKGKFRPYDVMSQV